MTSVADAIRSETEADPAAPAWFTRALADEPERAMIPVDGARIEMMRWSRPGRPGLLLIHGMAAHADWWSFLAPTLAQDFNVACLSLSGMGGSDWRDRYTLATYMREAMACIEWAGLAEGPTRPIIIGHSFGGIVAMQCRAEAGERLGAIVIADTIYLPGANYAERAAAPVPDVRYSPTAEDLMARFRLMPPQPCPPWIIRLIARKSIAYDEGRGWRWRFDPKVMWGAERSHIPTLLQRGGCPIALMHGELSEYSSREMVARLAMEAGGEVPVIELPDAGHHLLLDQPLAFVTGVRALLSAWPAPAA